ncbi:hypothetical protein KGD83_12250 [Nocardiopsis akebiae]|uniref:RAMA domain-containing protein n=1 Tax=Nocardiopsis akebiae TaxID=2831968 RepID=A0ABX8C9S8_9ACTN|nr:hypothetical protein [Nocardiopsis akebiae]QUX31189.1 hypothetical protein KGD83_12250 [Nocardiopsis akebiae]
MSNVIRVDAEVYAALQERAQPFVDTPNDVLRRVLGLDTLASNTVPDPGAPEQDATEVAKGALADMIRKGTLRAGEGLVWERGRLGVTHTATVTAGGRVRLDEGGAAPFKTPSGAARALCGHEINGWRQWRRASDGALLQDLR